MFGFTRQLNKFWKLAQSVVMKPVRPETHHSIDILPWPKRNMTSSSIMQRQYHIDLMCLQTHAGDYLFYCIGFVLGSICTASKQSASIYQRNSSPTDSDLGGENTRARTHTTQMPFYNLWQEKKTSSQWFSRLRGNNLHYGPLFFHCYGFLIAVP